MESLAGLFGVEVAAFDVLSNHLHVILRIRLDVVALWSDQEVARRVAGPLPWMGAEPDGFGGGGTGASFASIRSSSPWCRCVLRQAC